MKEHKAIVRQRQPDELNDPLSDILRHGARSLLAQAVEPEAEAFLAEMKDKTPGDGRSWLVRPGQGPEPEIQTGIGPVAVPRVKIREACGASNSSMMSRSTSQHRSTPPETADTQTSAQLASKMRMC